MRTAEPSKEFRTLVDQLSLPVFVLDRSGTFEYVSPELTDHVPAGDVEELVGEPAAEYVEEGDVEDLETVLAETAEEDSVTLRLEGQELTPRFETLAVNGEVLGCPADGPAEFALVLEQLHDVTNELYAADSVTDGLETVVEAAVEILGFDWCQLSEASEGAFVVRATSADSPVSVGEIGLGTDEGVAGAAYQSGEPRLTENARESDVARPIHDSITSSITVPVGSWGVFQAQSATAGAFDERDRQLAETLIAPLATMIERVEREKRLRESYAAQERQRRQIESLHTVARRMKAATSREEVYELAIDAIEAILEFDICIIDEADDGLLVPRAVGSNMSMDDYYDETPIDDSDNLGSLTYRENETFVVDDLHESGFAPAQSRYESALSLPLEDWGIMQIVSEERAAFDRTDRRLAELLVEHAVAAIDRIDRETELERRAEELAAQNARLDEFASIVSHDLRNPLNVASLRTEHALETGSLDSLDAVADALERMEAIVENVLTLARQGETVEETEPVNLTALGRRCWDRVHSGGHSLSIAASPVVEADRDRLEHLFENLFHNAIEHSPGEVTVEVGVLGDADGFYVEDDGPGIDEDLRETVFERGYTSADGGTGLGLAIVETVVDAHGWEIRVTEGAAGGARFEITGVSLVE